MGGVESRDFLPVWNPELKVLDLKRTIDKEEFEEHLKGKSSSDCLNSLPDNILEEISLYETLIASFNILSTLPSSLPLHLPHLNYIDLSHNRLIELPSSFGLFFHLKTLILHHNRLKKLPDSFTVLHKLEKVDLSWNKLHELPERWGDLKELSKLNVNNNRLRSLPTSLAKCRSLRVILAVGNKCIEPPQDICNAGSAEILNYIRKNLSSPESCLTEEINLFSRIRLNQIQSPLLDPDSEKIKYVQVKTDTVNTPYRVKTPLKFPPNSTVFSPEELKDKILGAIFGAVIGDALGLATEFMTSDENHFYYEETNLCYSDIVIDQHRLHWRKGQWTGTSDFMFVVLDSILQWGGVVDELDFATRLKSWKHVGLLDDGKSGYTTSSIINKVLSNADFVTMPHKVSTSLLEESMCNGSNPDHGTKYHHTSAAVDSAALPASVILGIVHFHNLSEVISNSVRICKATHAHPLCIAANIIASCLIALFLQGKHRANTISDVDELVSFIKVLAKENFNDVEIKQQVHSFLTQFDWKRTTEKQENIHDPFFTLKRAMLGLGISGNFKTILPRILMEGGHSTVIGCMAGAFLGSQIGFKALPSLWVNTLDSPQKNWLISKANILLDMMGLP